MSETWINPSILLACSWLLKTAHFGSHGTKKYFSWLNVWRGSWWQQLPRDLLEPSRLLFFFKPTKFSLNHFQVSEDLKFAPHPILTPFSELFMSRKSHGFIISVETLTFPQATTSFFIPQAPLMWTGWCPGVSSLPNTSL